MGTLPAEAGTSCCPADENSGVGAQVYPQLPQLVQDVFGVGLRRLLDGLLDLLGKDGLSSQQHIADELIIHHPIVLGVDFSDDFIIHGDDAALQAATELQVRLSIAEKQHIGGKAAYVHDKHPGRLQ